MMPRPLQGIFVWAVALVAIAAAPVVAQELQTPAEATNFQAGPTMYEPLMEFVMELGSRSPLMSVQKLTETLMGRDMLLCVLSNPPVHQPADVVNTGKPIVLIVNNVHGTEVAGKDASLILMRDLLFGAERPLLDRAVVLVVPTINPDGAEARRRTNEQGFDLNRDYVKLESQEVHAVVTKVINRWQPDIHIDTHHGGSAPYALVYQTNMHPSGDQNLMDLGNNVILQRVRAALRAEDYDGFWYTGPGRRDGVDGWVPTSVEPRKQHVYSTLANMAGFLFETPNNSHRVVDNGTRVVPIPREERYRHQVQGQYIGLREMIRFAAEETELLRRTIVEAKMSAIVRGSTVSDDDPIPLAYRQVAKYEDDFWVTPGRAGEAAADAPPDADYVLVRRPIFTKFEPTVTAQRPWGYLMPPQLAKVVPKLLEHSITVQRLSEPLTVEVETYYASSVTPRSYFQGHEMKRATAEARTNDVTFPAGSFFVPAGQPRSNLLCQLLEPTTEDSLVSWNFLDDWVRMSGQRSGNNDPPAEYNGFGDDDRQEQTGGQVQAQQQGERQGRGGRRGGRGGGGGGQMIPIHRLMQPAQIMGVIVEPFNTFESNRYIRWR